jgi:hypothetical protein
LWQQLGDLPFQADETGVSVVDGVDALLQDDLVCRMVELQRGQPPAVPLGPIVAAGEDPIVAQEEP